MNSVNLALRSLFKKGRHNVIKIMSLGVGLAMGLVLISKAYFELSYDDFYPDSNRIYRIQTDAVRHDEGQRFNSISGGVAPGMKAEIPEIEAATRIDNIGESVFFTQDKNRYDCKLIFGDTSLFDVLPRTVLSGDVKEILNRPMYAMVSRSLAEKIGEGSDVVGEVITIDGWPGRNVTIGGVFEDVPENTHLCYDIVLSISSTGQFFQYDGIDNWLGNDRYWGYVKLYPGVDPKSLASSVYEMQKRHQPLEELEQMGLKLTYTFLPLSQVYSNTPEIRQMAFMLTLLAFAILFTAVMNYILIIISSLVGRSREVAVHKCYGASGGNISRLILAETLLHVFLSLGVAILLILAFRGTIIDLLKASLGALFSWHSCLIMLGICIFVFVLTGFIPAYLFQRIPVASAFRSFKESRRYWKLILLFIQFMSASFLVTLLIIIGMQYDRMLKDDPGYTYDKLLYCDTQGIPILARQQAIEKLRSLPEVESVFTCSVLPIYSGSGNNVLLPNDERGELFNIFDLYWADADFIPEMNIKMLEGTSFQRGVTSPTDIVVSKQFVEKITQMTGWKDGVIGKSVIITEHQDLGACTIIGVYDMRMGAAADGAVNNHPSALFYSEDPSPYVMIKLHELRSENIQKVSDVLIKALPDKDILVTPYKTSMINLYSGSRLFRDSVLIGGIVSLIIALIGLIGYTNDETVRRSKEIAIRKVNGATAENIIYLLSKEIIYIALPAIILGIISSWIVGEKWLQQFSDKVPLSLVLFIASAFAVLIIVVLCVIFRAWSVANENPVISIKSE